MKRVTAFLLVAVGVINVAPLVGVVSVEQLKQLYDVDLASTDLIILMRHRAVLFGLVGSFIVFSAFKRPLQVLACVAGLVSMLSFIILAYASGDYGAALHKIIIADVVGSISLIAVLVLRRLPGPGDR